MFYVKSLCNWFSNYNYFPMSQFLFHINQYIYSHKWYYIFTNVYKKKITYAQIVGKLLCKVSLLCVY